MKTNEDENSMSSDNEIRFNPPLYIQRYQKAFDLLNQNYITKVADFGCAEGKFIRRLKKLENVDQIASIDCDDYCLEQCLYEARPLTWDIIFGRNKPLELSVYKGSVHLKDSRLKNFDAITCIELIEHLSADVLSQMPENIFGFIKPKVVIITTPNIEYNILFPELNRSSKLRHWDHKFEWTRSQFSQWSQSVINSYPDYTFEMSGVGEPPIHSKDVGFCTQIAIFTKKQTENKSNTKQFVDKHLTYKLIDNFNIEKSRQNQSHKTEEPFDWDSVLN